MRGASMAKNFGLEVNVITKADIDEAVQKLDRACLRLETKEKT